MKNFNFCIKEVLKSEGGYTNDPNDNGGPTNFGITIVDYRKYINKNGTANDVRNMTVDQAKNIYKSKYWDALSCDSLESGVDYTCFDYGVNSGLQRPRNCLKKFADKKGIDLINAINDERTAFFHAIGGGHNAGFLKGWLSRVNRVRSDSIKLYQTVPQAPKASGGIIAAGAATAASFWQWGLHHWIEITASAAFLGLLTYVVIHFYHKAKQ